MQTYAPFIDLPTGVALGILAVICLSFCQELIAFIVLLIVNTIRGTGPREYIRLYAWESLHCSCSLQDVAEVRLESAAS